MDTPDIFHDTSTGHDSDTHPAPHTGTSAHHLDTSPYPGSYHDHTQPLAATQAGPEIGNPGQYEHYWFYQGKDGYCAPSSVTQVIEAQTGHTIHSYTAVVSEAHKLAIPFNGTGMTMPQARELLTAFGITSHLEQPPTPQQGLDQLAQDLAQGKSIILSVNADPLWYGTQTDPGNPDGAPDHALVITAINAQTGEVTLSDPGTPDGNQEQVPLTTFMDAWEASGCQMLVTDHAAGTQDTQIWSDTQHIEGTATRTVQHGETDAGFVILSIALGLGIRRAAHATQTHLHHTQHDNQHDNHPAATTVIAELEA